MKDLAFLKYAGDKCCLTLHVFCVVSRAIQAGIQLNTPFLLHFEIYYRFKSKKRKNFGIFLKNFFSGYSSE